MKTTAAIALCALTVSLAACTTTDETPPGSVAGLNAAEEGDEPNGIPEVDELDPSDEVAAEGEESGEPGVDAEGATQTAGPGDSAPATAEGADATAQPDRGEPALGENGESAVAGSAYPNPAEMTDVVCQAFFEGAAPLAARADDARLLVRQGAQTNLSPLDVQEIDVLAQQLDELAAEASDAQAELFQTMNAPFTEVVTAAEGAGEGEVSYDSIETVDSDGAQQGFTRECLATSGLG
ncbi:MAG: hypothetical protein WA962_11145 [Ornithinimicrobium sp.]